MSVKELLMLIGGIFMAKRKVVAMAYWPGKVATGLFAIGVMFSRCFPSSRFRMEPWDMTALALATAMSCFALVYYAFKQLPRAFDKNKGSPARDLNRAVKH